MHRPTARFPSRPAWLRTCIAAVLAGALALGWPATGASAKSEAPALAVGDLRVDYLPNPVGIDDTTPALSWQLSSAQRNQAQRGYQVLVASSTKQLSNGRGDLWDSGKVTSRRSLDVRYAGRALRSRERAYWAVRVWDEHGRASAWSAPAHWEMGLLAKDDWSARWIANPSWLDPSNPVVIGFAGQRARYLRLDVTRLGKPIKEGFPNPVSRLQLAELEVYNGDTLISRGAKATASESYEAPGQWQLSAINDGKLTSNAAPQGYTSYERTSQDLGGSSIWVEFDLGRDVDLDTVRLYPRTDTLTADGQTPNFPENFSLQDRADGAVSYTVIRSVTGQATPPPPAKSQSMPLFAKSFQLTKPVTSARLYATGLGVYEARLNGDKLGDAVLEPANTDYRKRVQYTTYDVTRQLHAGANTLGFLLGNGVYNMPGTPGRYQKYVGSMGPPKLLAQLEMTFADGTTTTVASDGEWRTADGPITFSSWYGGEDHDARREPGGWDGPRADLSAWGAAAVTGAPTADTVLSAQTAPPVKVMETLTAVSRREIKPGTWVYDLGRNIAGWPQITVRGAKDAAVRLTPGELLSDDGTPNQSQSGGPAYFTFTPASDAAVTWHPRFSYYGFRWIQVTGLSQPPAVEDVKGVVLRAANDRTGSFTSSDVMLNRIHDLVVRATDGNMFSVFTDCPHREKLGWLEETHLVFGSVAANYDVAAYYHQLVRNMSDAQLPNGMVPDIAPEYTVFGGGFRDDPNWGGAVILSPWQEYQTYGDAGVLRDNFAAMQRYMDYLASKADNHILSHGLGDWVAFDTSTPLAVTATTVYYRLATAMREIARAVGDQAVAGRYNALAGEIGTAFNATFFHPDTKSYASGSQASNAMPLAAGMVPDDAREAVLAHVVADVRARGNHLSTGEIALPGLLDVLADGGHADVVLDLAKNPTSPSYAYQVLHGATTLTEMWDGPTSGASQNHFMLGAIDDWFYRYLGGIRTDAPGFERFTVRPELSGGQTHVRAERRSPYGQIVSDWSRHGRTLHLGVDVPVNTTATVYVPVRQGTKAAALPGAKLLRVEGDRAVYEVGSGHWSFVSQTTDSAPEDRVPVVVEPVSGDVAVLPGRPATATFRLHNIGDKPVTVRPEATASAGFTATPDAGSQQVTIPAGGAVDAKVGVERQGAATSGTVNLRVEDSQASIAITVSDNVARAATMSASSTWPGFSPAKANDGRTGMDAWDSGDGWNDGTMNAFPDTLTATWDRASDVGRVKVFTLDRPNAPASRDGVRDYDVEALVGGGWKTVATVRGNTAGVIESRFDPVSATALRLVVRATNDGQFSRVIELEAFAAATSGVDNPSTADATGTARGIR